MYRLTLLDRKYRLMYHNDRVVLNIRTIDDDELLITVIRFILTANKSSKN